MLLKQFFIKFNFIKYGSHRIHIYCPLRLKYIGNAVNEVVDKRNIGIIAHIDAGKTTVTERILYLSGLTNTIGDVDDGNTITDFMDLERERGITIQSAAISCLWQNHKVNIIDTPGHVDFTIEVERSLRVMDGIVTVIDGSAGVQAQTITVINQAKQYNLPSVFFVNKMDKLAANYDYSIESIENCLGYPVVPVVVPIIINNDFIGLVDLFKKTYLNVKDMKSTWVSIKENEKLMLHYTKNWENLLSKLAEVDDDFEKMLLFSSDFSLNDVKKSLKKAVLNHKLFPIACGTALKSFESTRPILDMVIDYLPSPMERSYDIHQSADFVALVFKINHNKTYGQMAFTRIYKGHLKTGQSVINANYNKKETGLQIYTPYSDILQPIQGNAEAGDIVVILGLKNTVTGNTLINSSQIKNNSKINVQNFALPGIKTFDPVFSCSIESPSTSLTKQFEKALKELIVEDPSLRIRKDRETCQTILEGMGELHIEIIKERLKREYGLNVFMGPLRVSYREILNKSIIHSTLVEDKFGENKHKQWCFMRLELNPTKEFYKFENVLIDNNDKDEMLILHENWLFLINEGCKVALYNGPLLGFSVNNLMITLRALSTSGHNVNSALISACASRCVKEALKLAGTNLIEPVIKFNITLMQSANKIMHTQNVLKELSKRRSFIDSVNEENNSITSIHGTMPLSESTGIANCIRELTSGMCDLHMQFFEYQKVLPDEQLNILKNFQQK